MFVVAVLSVESHKVTTSSLLQGKKERTWAVVEKCVCVSVSGCFAIVLYWGLDGAGDHV